MKKHFDKAFQGPEGETTHHNGLNIHALILQNSIGRILGLQQNRIHTYNNPLLHAEQLTLKEAIETMNSLSPRNPSLTSVESYYRTKMFNDTNNYDALRAGATLYTTLEPCPFCTAALLVSRVKRIVFFTADTVYGGSFYKLWADYYRKNDIHYEQLSFDTLVNNSIVRSAGKSLQTILQKISRLPGVPGTLYFDSMENELGEIAMTFEGIKDSDCTSEGDDLLNNRFLLTQFRNRLDNGQRPETLVKYAS